MLSVAALNAEADAVAALYEGAEVVMFADVPDFDTPVPAEGDVTSDTVAFTAGGVEGPTDDHTPVDGLCWSNVLQYDLDEVATWYGLVVDGQLWRAKPLMTRLGPGPVKFTFGIGPDGQPQ